VHPGQIVQKKDFELLAAAHILAIDSLAVDSFTSPFLPKRESLKTFLRFLSRRLIKC
jgi:hypothetical protein